MRTRAVLLTAACILAASIVLMNTNAQSQAGTDMDRRQECYNECNNRYGGLDVFPPRGGDAGIYRGWADCRVRCEREFWKDFDKDSGSD